LNGKVEANPSCCHSWYRHHGSVEKTPVGRLKVELQAAHDGALSRSEGGIVGVEIPTDNEFDVG
jgi:hypothetical protein